MKSKYFIILATSLLAATTIFYCTKVTTKHVLFIVTEGTHVHPTFELVKELIKKNTKVTYLLFNKTCKEALTLQNLGAHVLSLPEEILTQFNSLTDEQYRVLINPKSNYVDQPEGIEDPSILSYYFMALLWDELLTITKKINPDVIVYDVFLNGWGKYVARSLNIPAFASLAPAFSYGPAWKSPEFGRYLADYYHAKLPATEKRIWAVQYLHEKLGPIAQGMNVDIPVTFSDPEYATFIYSYPSFIDYKGEQFLGTNLLFTGYVNYKDDALTEKDQLIIDEIKQHKCNKKLIFVSMGTVSSKPKEFFAMIAEALGNKSLINSDILVALHPGDKDVTQKEKHDAQQISTFIQELGHSNFIVHDYFPLNALLNDIDIFISHGGNNSSMQALQHYIPMILLPIHGDQLWVAKTFQDFKLAQTVPAEFNPMLLKNNFKQWQTFTLSNKYTQCVKWIHKAVRNIINNPELQKQSLTKKDYIDSLLQTNQGYKKAIELIIKK